MKLHLLSVSYGANTDRYKKNVKEIMNYTQKPQHDKAMESIKYLQHDWDMVVQDLNAIKQDFPFQPQRTRRRRL